jgi:predicted RNA-binding Zn-ribbon protein involved in translation (DUF1610 family)
MISMAEIICASCGHKGKAEDKWLKCPECGYTMCHRCGIQKKKEQKLLETIRTGDAHERAMATCPNCNYDMFYH